VSGFGQVWEREREQEKKEFFFPYLVRPGKEEEVQCCLQ